MDIQRKAFESSNNVNPDWYFKFDEELQQYIALDSEMELQVDEFNEHWDTFRAGWQAKAQAVPDLGELQERIAGHQYYHDKHGHMIVDMDDVVKEISGFDSWKAQVVPDTYTPIVLALEDVQSKIAKKSFLTMDEKNEKEIMAVDANELAEYIDELIEAQEPAND